MWGETTPGLTAWETRGCHRDHQAMDHQVKDHQSSLCIPKAPCTPSPAAWAAAPWSVLLLLLLSFCHGAGGNPGSRTAAHAGSCCLQTTQTSKQSSVLTPKKVSSLAWGQGLTSSGAEEVSQEGAGRIFKIVCSFSFSPFFFFHYLAFSEALNVTHLPWFWLRFEHRSLMTVFQDFMYKWWPWGRNNLLPASTVKRAFNKIPLCLQLQF